MVNLRRIHIRLQTTELRNVVRRWEAPGSSPCGRWLFEAVWCWQGLVLAAAFQEELMSTAEQAASAQHQARRR